MAAFAMPHTCAKFSCGIALALPEECLSQQFRPDMKHLQHALFDFGARWRWWHLPCFTDFWSGTALAPPKGRLSQQIKPDIENSQQTQFDFQARLRWRSCSASYSAAEL